MFIADITSVTRIFKSSSQTVNADKIQMKLKGIQSKAKAKQTKQWAQA